MIRVRSTTQINQKRSQDRKPSRFVRSTTPGGIAARGRRGEALASAHDRQRLRERTTAERQRVKGMIASVAFPLERRAHPREPGVSEFNPASVSFELRAVQPAGCPVCGDDRIVTDEVMHGGTLRVSECLHCEHRWTQRPTARWAELGARMNRSERPHPRAVRV